MATLSSVLELISLYDFKEETIKFIDAATNDPEERADAYQMTELMDFNAITDITIEHIAEKFTDEEIAAIMEFHRLFPDIADKQRDLMMVANHAITEQISNM
jgi:hypothetical protein